MLRARTAGGLFAMAVLLTTPACGTADAVRATAGPRPTTTTTPPPRTVTEQAWTPFATVGGITLTHPATRVEHVGFHQSNHDGAQQLTALPTAASPMTLGDRERDTGGR